MLRVLIVDDEPLARENLRVLLQEQPDIEIVGECANAIEAIGAVHKLRRTCCSSTFRCPELADWRWSECSTGASPLHCVFDRLR